MYRSLIRPRRARSTGRNRLGSGRKTRGTRLLLALACLLPLASGCQTPGNGGGMSDSYYINPYKDLNTLGRVALVELDDNSGYPTISADVTKALFVALQKKQIFGVTVVPHDDPEWRGLQDNLDSLQALQRLLTMRETLNCSGIIVGTITEYQPYPRMAIGLRLKLLDLTDGQLLWGLEQVWDTADRNIEKRIESYFREELRSGVASLREELVVVSSLKFAKFVAYEVAETLDREQD
ncbi:MAG: hypothetical protein JSW27_21115 [Phycisphaerales bacterium]|nr:MAG: hypothetical protein JSW27_21115 [Phycisphaerales bacterium]